MSGYLTDILRTTHRFHFTVTSKAADRVNFIGTLFIYLRPQNCSNFSQYIERHLTGSSLEVTILVNFIVHSL